MMLHRDGESFLIFALDIGTRSVVGLLLEQDQSKFRIKDIVVKEHEERAMLDGQIHDILAVSKVITYVKEKLEEKHGPLKKVCVAAAGRALKTQTAYAIQDIKGKALFTEDDIFLLELSAVQEAQRKLLQESEIDYINQYFCVGYSVLRYYLDEEEIGSLLDQRGEKASVEIISTFLPKIVVESLISALQRSDLQLEALTLEPIAAINALIPPSMRRLNVALVDIGAGTSDVAISMDGTVTAYGMVPVAGDEITEGLSDAFLLDFPQAEQAKRDLLHYEEVTFTDILGFQQTLSKQEMVDQIFSSIEKLASSITKEIKRQNNQIAPKAVMLVGGGSLTPSLPSLIAEKLGLPENRVAIRGVDAIQQLDQTDIPVQGPEYITPVGIAIAAKEKPIEYVSVTVNELPVRLFDVKKLTIGDSLLAAGISINKLVGKPGLALMVEVNGKSMTCPGSFGEAPKILRNGQPAQSFDPIENGDVILVEKGVDGKSAALTITEVIGSALPTISVSVNGLSKTINPSILLNGQPTALEQPLADRDKVTYAYPDTIGELLIQNCNIAEQDLEPFYLFINDEKTNLSPFSVQVKKNGKQVSIDDHFSTDDNIVWEKGSTPTVKMLSIVQQYETKEEIAVTYKGKKVVLSKVLLEFYRNGQLLLEEDLLNRGDHLQVMVRRKEPFIFQDMFRFVDIDRPQGAGSFILKKNGTEASFYDFIDHGDELDIEWKSKLLEANIKDKV
ncbi:cell division protein FtsA [Sutcliffiella horikoshii]|uniref:Cell division protein FtsA n=1 Tax=Sutcliffiella horikoshii TaxID=79883 RepID=A0A5D4T382_9BACI|nr:cell division protein FtsA [Sutcliffiella horikoshii]TYS69098.1 cell division protein FtsA [Sutcliffiella horikoshii]